MRKTLLWISFMILFIFSLLSANMIEITVAQADHDIAVVSVTPSSTSVRVDEFVNITVVVENQGTNNETFDITVYYGNETIQTTINETQNVVNQAPNTNKTLTFTWNTTNTREEIYATENKEKTYDINATATLASDENPADNTLVREDAVKVISQYIAVIPQSTVDTTLTPDKNYTVSIYTDYNGSDVWSYDFALSYNPNVLEGIEVVNGDLIVGGDAQFQDGDFDNILGKLSFTGAFFFYLPPAEPPMTSGPGILANVTFRVKGLGDSNITLVEDKTKLRNPDAGFQGVIISNALPHFHHILHGYFRNIEVVTHNIAVVSVTPSLTSVKAGVLVNITVVVENQGTVTETFDVKVYYEYTRGAPNFYLVGTQTVISLENGTSTSLTFTWNTTNVDSKSYTITALAVELSGETDTEDNMLDSVETVTIEARKETPLPVELIIGIVVVVVAIVVVVYAVRRRKKPIPV